MYFICQLDGEQKTMDTGHWANNEIRNEFEILYRR